MIVLVLHVALVVVVGGVFGVHGAAAGGSISLPAEENPLSLLIAVPLTKNNQNVPDPGWIQLASALIAIDHFNTRNTSVVSELVALRDCNVRIDAANVSVLDTGTNEHLILEDLMELRQPRKPIQAIVGPYNEIPALELSVLATMKQIPIVAHRTVDTNLLLPERHPYFSQVNADPLSEMAFLASYLNHTRRHDYIAVVYASSAACMQKVDLLRVILDKQGMKQVRTFSYNNGDNGLAEALPDVSIQSALQKVKATGFRTIVWISNDIRKDSPLIHEAASSFQLDRGKHFWIFSGGVATLSSIEQHEFIMESNASFQPTNFMRGCAFLTPYDGVGMNTKTKFEVAMLQQDTAFVERLDDLTPIANYYNWSYAIEAGRSNQTAFEAILERLNSWWFGASYIYDATMAIGFGACEAVAAAKKKKGNSTTTVTSNTTTTTTTTTTSSFTGQDHLKGIRSVDFQGATGRIAFKSVNSGSRLAGTEPMAVVNLLPPGRNDHPIWMTEIRDPLTGQFSAVGNFDYHAFIYADGSHHPPYLLRDTPNQHYLSPAVRRCGLAMMGIALAMVAASVIWIGRHHDHTVVIAAPPIYLYSLCLGAFVVAFDIWVFSHDESQGWDQDMLSTACVTSFWLKTTGVLIIYNSMFTKHWRLDLLIRRKSNHIEIWRMVWPSCIFSILIYIILGHCTATNDYGWYRVVVDDVSGESIGSCNTSTGETGWSFYVVTILLLIPIFHAARVAYKTLGMDELYSESKWVLVYILLQFQVFVVGGPVTHILDGVSSDAKFVAEAMLNWTISTSTIGLMIVPKMWKIRQMYLKAVEAENDGQQRRRSTETTAVRRNDNNNNNNNNNESPVVVVASAPPPQPPPLRDSVVSSSSLRGSTNGPRIQIVTFD